MALAQLSQDFKFQSGATAFLASVFPYPNDLYFKFQSGATALGEGRMNLHEVVAFKFQSGATAFLYIREKIINSL